ncbi:MAG: ester cyclase [Candidatus Limnocylindria bacterium]
MQDAKALEANKQVVRRYKVGILNSRDVDALDEIVGADYLDHAAFAGQAPGLEGLRQRVRFLFATLDPHWTIHDMVAERDLVVIRWSHTGTHRGEFLGVPATGKRFTFRGIDVYRILAGKMAEHWNVVDALGFLQQVDGTRSSPA